VANWIVERDDGERAGILRRREAEEVRVACGDDGVIDVDRHAA
jgi:hypothetical protein